MMQVPIDGAKDVLMRKKGKGQYRRVENVANYISEMVRRRKHLAQLFLC